MAASSTKKENDNIHVKCITFSQPPVGNAALREYVFGVLVKHTAGLSNSILIFFFPRLVRLAATYMKKGGIIFSRATVYLKIWSPEYYLLHIFITTMSKECQWLKPQIRHCQKRMVRV